MISSAILPAGIAPMGPQNPNRKFKKKDGSYSKTSDDLRTARAGVVKIQYGPRFYNVEGEAGMREYLPEAEAAIKFQTDDYSAYQSWLCSFASLSQEHNQRRREKTKVDKPSHRWATKKQKINTHLACYLHDDEEWGYHIDTLRDYRDRMQRSQMERKGNTKDDGKALYLVNTMPLDYTVSMSNQIPIEGHEHRARPPTVTELVSKAWKKFYENGYRADVSKVTRPILPNNTRTLSVEELTQYGTPVNSPPWEGDYVEHPINKQEIAARRRERYEARKLVKSRTKESVESMVVSELGEFSETDFTTSEEETARYLSWMNCPELMRKALYTDRLNYHIPSAEALQEFNNKFPPSEQQWYDHFHEEDEDRYLTWLMLRDYQNNPMRVLKPLKIPLNTPSLERRRLIASYAFSTCSDKSYDLEKHKNTMENFFKLAKLERIKQQGFVLLGDGDSKDWTREEKKQKMRDSYVQDRFVHKLSACISKNPPCPMTDIEYENITRSKITTVDEYVTEKFLDDRDFIIEEGFNAFGPVTIKWKDQGNDDQEPLLGPVKQQ